jgi:hypothetical protein
MKMQNVYRILPELLTLRRLMKWENTVRGLLRAVCFEGVNSIQFGGREGLVAGTCKHGNESSNCMKANNLLLK